MHVRACERDRARTHTHTHTRTQERADVKDMFAVNEGGAACSSASAKAAGTAGKEQGGSRRGGGKGRSKEPLGIDDNSTTRWHQVRN
jgi:hypothetical protein